MITLDQKSRFQELTQEYEELRGDGSSQQELAAEEQSIFDEIAKKFDEIQSFIEASENASDQSGSQGDTDGDAQNRKSGRMEKLKGMRALMSGLMTSLKKAQ